MYNDPAALQRLVAQAGPALDLARVTAYEGDHAWSLVFDDGRGSTIDVEWDSVAERAMFTAEVSIIPAGARLPAFELLLQYNYLWGEHGGVRTALTGSEGDVVLLFDLPLADLDLPRLCEVLSNLHAIAASFRTVLARVNPSAAGAGTTVSGDQTDGLAQGNGSAFPPHMIRV